jgi:hypothetical protein
MSREPSYCILLLPSREIVRRACSLREAAAWLATYNAIMRGAGAKPAIVEEPPREPSGLMARRG